MVAAPTGLAVREQPQLATGDLGPSFEGLQAVDGRVLGMADFADARLLVVIFASNRCPTVHAYDARLRRLHDQYGPRGVQIVMINANDPHLYPEERFERMVAFAEASGYPFPYLQDRNQATARAYGATCTFHLFVLDEDRRLRYQGRFDDARLEERIRVHDLRNALDDLLADRPVAVPETRAFGCSLDYV